MPREPDPEPRALPRLLMLRLIDTVSSPKTAARFRVMLETGLPPSDMMRMEPGDLTLEGKEPSMLLRRRRKGKGRKPLRVPLTREAVAALRVFVSLGCFGPFDPSSARRVLKTARKALILDEDTTPEERRLLERMRNYDLRHTFGNTIYEATKNLVLTQHMMGHASPQTTHDLHAGRGGGPPEVGPQIRGKTLGKDARMRERTGKPPEPKAAGSTPAGRASVSTNPARIRRSDMDPFGQNRPHADGFPWQNPWQLGRLRSAQIRPSALESDCGRHDPARPVLIRPQPQPGLRRRAIPSRNRDHPRFPVHRIRPIRRHSDVNVPQILDE